MITQSELKSILHYCPETGIFTWINSPRPGWNGKEAGYPHMCKKKKKLYKRIKVGEKGYLLHRVAFLYMTGSLPKNDVDHKDSNGLNNRWINLREATNTQNAKNRMLNSNSTSKIKGVSFHKKNKKWVGYVNSDGTRHYLGLFSKIEEAELAVREKRVQLHGEFYSHG